MCSMVVWTLNMISSVLPADWRKLCMAWIECWHHCHVVTMAMNRRFLPLGTPESCCYYRHQFLCSYVLFLLVWWPLHLKPARLGPKWHHIPMNLRHDLTALRTAVSCDNVHNVWSTWPVLPIVQCLPLNGPAWLAFCCVARRHPH